MFQKSDKNVSDILNSFEQNLGSVDPLVLGQFCDIEEWAVDVKSGLMSIGPITEHKFGLVHSRTGLLKLLERYGKSDRLKLASFFEKASEQVVTFTHCAQISAKPGDIEPVTMIAKSAHGRSQNSKIFGIFIFPKK